MENPNNVEQHIPLDDAQLAAMKAALLPGVRVDAATQAAIIKEPYPGGGIMVVGARPGATLMFTAALEAMPGITCVSAEISKLEDVMQKPGTVHLLKDGESSVLDIPRLAPMRTHLAPGRRSLALVAGMAAMLGMGGYGGLGSTRRSSFREDAPRIPDLPGSGEQQPFTRFDQERLDEARARRERKAAKKAAAGRQASNPPL